MPKSICTFIFFLFHYHHSVKCTCIVFVKQTISHQLSPDCVTSFLLYQRVYCVSYIKLNQMFLSLFFLPCILPCFVRVRSEDSGETV